MYWHVDINGIVYLNISSIMHWYIYKYRVMNYHCIMGVRIGSMHTIKSHICITIMIAINTIIG